MNGDVFFQKLMIYSRDIHKWIIEHQSSNIMGPLSLLDLSRHNNNNINDISITTDIGSQSQQIQDAMFVMYHCAECRQPPEILVRFPAFTDQGNDNDALFFIGAFLGVNRICPSCFATITIELLLNENIEPLIQFNNPYLDMMMTISEYKRISVFEQISLRMRDLLKETR
jgi:hypothetical protein